jgi:selenocysteine lyase/cysteine desulfurase
MLSRRSLLVAVVDELWKRSRIFATAITHDQFQGLRVSPSVYTRMSDIDLFVRTMMAIAG